MVLAVCCALCLPAFRSDAYELWPDSAHIGNGTNTATFTADILAATDTITTASLQISSVSYPVEIEMTQGHASNVAGIEVKRATSSLTAGPVNGTSPGTQVFNVKAYGLDTAGSFIQGATIVIRATGTVNTGIVPMAFEFQVADTVGSPTTVLTIDSSGAYFMVPVRCVTFTQ